MLDRISIQLNWDRWNLSISPREIRVRPGDGIEIELSCKNASSMEVRFSGESPFTASQFNGSDDRVVLREFLPILLEESRFPFDVFLQRADAEKVDAARLSGVIVIKTETEKTGKRVEIKMEGDRVVAVPERIRVNRPKDERVEWFSNEGNFVVSFDKPYGGPFETDVVSGQRTVPSRSARWKVGVLRHSYAYSIRFWPAIGGPPVDADPSVEVDDSGGTGG